MVMLAATTFFAQQLKANNFLEFQAKREQLRLTIIGQFLNDPDNCKCLLGLGGGVTFPVTGTTELIGFTQPDSVGKFLDPNTCAGGIPQPFVTKDGVDGLRLDSVQLINIVPTGGGYYSGFLNFNVESIKEATGPKILRLSLQVAIKTEIVGAQAQFLGCSSASGPPLNPPIIQKVNYRGLSSGTATCPVGTMLISGGCDWDSNDKTPDLMGHPNSANGWYCWTQNPDGDYDVYAYALCIPN